ncbi:polysaccharide pyruvyl transferase family protein [Streptomyces pathocidini]|uniref:Polysaccharide pyruvyl transferase family protein n=1 Tax=Streptomyces pathocidini TaxID=1650571 RepID=A0ABW7URD3_9ACTN|nr:polysaccharide pyruvyl transferase family protein [Streptomyces pathocidini]
MSKRRRIIYLGWQGYHNFGDDLIHQTWRTALADPLDIEAPLAPLADSGRVALRTLGHRLRLAGTERIVLLGGGTALGFDIWGEHAQRALSLYRADSLVIAGAGAPASHDGFALGLFPANWARWQGISDVALLGVRGPLSRDECATHWRDTTVIGDPALLYPRLMPLRPAPRERHIIGVCLGAAPASRFDTATVVEAVRSYRSTHPDSTVRVLQLADTDAEVSRTLAEQLQAEVVVFRDGVQSMMESIADCSILLSERLHGTIAAVACGVPAVPLSYATKCDDFWLSVTGELPLLTPGTTRDQILAELHRATDPVRLAETAGRVERLQERLLAAVAALRHWQNGEISTQQLSAPDSAKALR